MIITSKLAWEATTKIVRCLKELSKIFFHECLLHSYEEFLLVLSSRLDSKDRQSLRCLDRFVGLCLILLLYPKVFLKLFLLPNVVLGYNLLDIYHYYHKFLKALDHLWKTPLLVPGYYLSYMPNNLQWPHVSYQIDPAVFLR